MMNLIRRCVVILTLISLGFGVAGRSQAASDWAVNPARLGMVDGGGRYARAYPVGPIYAAPEFGFMLQLTHGLDHPADSQGEWDTRRTYLRKQAGLPVDKVKVGNPKAGVRKWQSQWYIPQLASLTFPVNRDRIVWVTPSGGEIVFNRETMNLAKPTFGPEGWRCEEKPSGEHVISDREGWVWSYLGGHPLRLTAPSGRWLEFFYEKDLPVRIVQHAGAEEKAPAQEIVSLAYDKKGQMVRLVAGPVEHRFTYDATTGFLMSWQSTAFLLGGGLPERPQVKETLLAGFPAVVFKEPKAPTVAEASEKSPAQLGTIRFLYVDELLAATQFPDGRVERLQWDVGEGRLLADGSFTYQYTGIPEDEFTLTAIDRGGRTASVYSNKAKNQMTMTSPDGTSETTAYERHLAGRGLISEKRGADGRLLAQIDYNDHHLPVRIRALGQPVIRNVYDDLDRLVAVWRAPIADMNTAATPAATDTAPRGELVQKLTYEGDRLAPSSVTDALAQTMQFVRDARGQLVRTNSPGEVEHQFAYDDWGRLVRHVLPVSTEAETTIRYDDLGRPVESKSPDEKIATMSYDKWGRLEARTENGITYTYAYDERWRPVEVKRNGKRWLNWSYALEELTLMQPKQAPATWPKGPGKLPVSTVVFTDPRGQITTRYTDAEGRLMEVVNALGERTSYRYNALGENIGWVDARGAGLVLTRDHLGRIVRQENALGQVLTWAFDVNGRLASRSNGVQTATYRYDDIGRLVQIDYGKGQTITYKPDGYGRVEVAATAEVTTKYRYDVLNRITRVEQYPAQGLPSGVGYGYALTGQKAVVTLLKPDTRGGLQAGSTTRTNYNKLGQVMSVLLDGMATTRNDYNLRIMRLTARHLGNGVNYFYTYDQQGQMNQLQVFDAQGKRQEQIKYIWNDFGLLEKRVLMRRVSDLMSTTVELNYLYDALGRLVSVRSPQDPRQEKNYVYDGAGNLVENHSPDHWIKMEYDAANQLVTKTEQAGDQQAPETTRFDYDPAGRLLQETVGGRVDRSFVYGYLDKVMAVGRADGHGTAYVYDANGMLVRRGPNGGNQPDSTARNWETWVWDGLALVQKGGEIYVNEPHPAGGTTLMSRTPTPPPEKPQASAPQPTTP